MSFRVLEQWIRVNVLKIRLTARFVYYSPIHCSIMGIVKL